MFWPLSHGLPRPQRILEAISHAEQQASITTVGPEIASQILWGRPWEKGQNAISKRTCWCACVLSTLTLSYKGWRLKDHIPGCMFSTLGKKWHTFIFVYTTWWAFTWFRYPKYKTYVQVNCQDICFTGTIHFTHRSLGSATEVGSDDGPILHDEV